MWQAATVLCFWHCYIFNTHHHYWFSSFLSWGIFIHIFLSLHNFKLTETKSFKIWKKVYEKQKISMHDNKAIKNPTHSHIIIIIFIQIFPLYSILPPFLFHWKKKSIYLCLDSWHARQTYANMMNYARYIYGQNLHCK